MSRVRKYNLAWNFPIQLPWGVGSGSEMAGAGEAADVEAVFRMSGRRLMCYERVARPIAEAFIDKGRNLSPEESRAAMTAAR